eukprot:TRINITY_DN4819_c0_g1_i3.p1 TRINITY_DN4819_c0_g1~~TRINITY_DN4819_c0_g1_i3.p1  ORF type:complete len:293 (-),score=28.60 TRINITY_DN4819_c0_g1_i3:56-934(-)
MMLYRRRIFPLFLHSAHRCDPARRRRKRLLALLLLDEVSRRRDYLFPHVERQISSRVVSRADLERFACSFCFRFLPDDIVRLPQWLEIPDPMRVGNGPAAFNAGALECICVTLYVLAENTRLESLEPLFGRSSAALCRIIQACLAHLAERWRNLLQFASHLLGPDQLAQFAASIFRKSPGYEHCVGFIDGTMVRCARPAWYGWPKVSVLRLLHRNTYTHTRIFAHRGTHTHTHTDTRCGTHAYGREVEIVTGIASLVLGRQPNVGDVFADECSLLLVWQRNIDLLWTFASIC